MNLFYAFSITFVFMLLFPILLGTWVAKSKSSPLFIQKSNTKNPRYFALSFGRIFDKALESSDGSGKVRMSHEEYVIEADKVEVLPGQTYDSLVYAEEKPFVPGRDSVFLKEIYAKNDAIFKNIPIVRAVACIKNLLIGEGTQIIRWADSEGVVVVEKNCDLGVSTTSSSKLLIGRNCVFKRLYAPEIYIGQDVNEESDFCCNRDEKDMIIYDEILRDIKYVDDELVDNKGFLKKTILTKYDLRILGGLKIQGDIKSEQDVKIDEKGIVYGNIFAEGNVILAQNTRVFGMIFTQGNVVIEDGAAIGQPGKIKSIVARGDVSFNGKCKVYGYVGAEGRGKIA